MRTGRFILIVTCAVMAGAIGGYLIGWAAWQLGFELLGSAIALVGAGIGGIVLLILAFERFGD